MLVATSFSSAFDMFRLLRTGVERAWLHLALWCCSIAYILIGAAFFHLLEEKKMPVPLTTKLHHLTLNNNSHSYHSNSNRSMTMLSSFRPPSSHIDPVPAKKQTTFLSVMEDKLNGMTLKEQRLELEKFKEVLTVIESALANGKPLQQAIQSNYQWDYGSSVLFAFTVISTIGYGNIAPTTMFGRLFCMVYALFGIPLFMIGIADLGKFLVDGVQFFGRKLRKMVVQRRSKKNGKFPNSDVEPVLDEKDNVEVESNCWMGGSTLTLSFTFVVMFIALLLPFWEDLEFFDAVYFSFVTVTTIGFGDIVPQKKSVYLLPLTLLLITFGLALTTMTIEAASGVFKQIHYFGTKLKNVKDVIIWFGGRQLTVGKLVANIGKKFGIPEDEMMKLDLDNFVDQVTEGLDPNGPLFTIIDGPDEPSPQRSPSPVRPENIRALFGSTADGIDFADTSSEDS